MNEIDDHLFLTVVMRTQGGSLAILHEALESLSRQIDQNFEIVVAVHTDSFSTYDQVLRFVSGMELAICSRVIWVANGGRTEPLTAAIAVSAGEYVAFLDDDDLAHPDWVQNFHSGAVQFPDAVVRSITQQQQWASSNTGTIATGDAITMFPGDFDLVAHFLGNQTPICSIAVPMTALQSLGIRFCADLPVYEDWDFVLQLASACRIVDTGRVTTTYRRWEKAGSESKHASAVWHGAYFAVLRRANERSYVFGPGAAWAFRQSVIDRDALKAKAAAFETSGWWRMTALPRSLGAKWRSFRAPVPKPHVGPLGLNELDAEWLRRRELGHSWPEVWQSLVE